MCEANGCVVAFAGRLVDAPDAADICFPTDAVPRVKAAIVKVLEALGATELVSSGAAGSDLLAQDAASTLGLAREIVLPFDRQAFLQTSVASRPGDWLKLFQALVAASANVTDLGLPQSDQAYEIATYSLLERAHKRAAKSGARVAVVLAWEGRPKNARDVTGLLGDLARQRGLELREICTKN